MPRPLRIKYPGAWYHIMNRGLGRRKIFLNDTHRQLFIDTLIETITMHHIEIHAYCLMNNHYHLLVKTPEGNISQAMKHLDGVYTIRFNRLMKNDGPLFRGRYKSILVDDDGYQLYVSRYIHLNPVDAKIVTRAEDYPWSSCAAYYNGQNKPDWLQTSIILEQIETRVSLRHIENYRAYVETQNLEDLQTFYSQKYTSPIFGSKQFCELALMKVDESHAKASAHEIRRAKPRVLTEELINSVCQYYSISESTLFETQRGRLNWPRQVLMTIARKRLGYSLLQIAEIFPTISPVTVSTLIRKCQLKIQTCEHLKNELEEVAIVVTADHTQGDA